MFKLKSGLRINKIHCGNCLELMKRISDNSIDLTVTSPPYDNLRTYEGYSFDFKCIAKELYRVTKQGGVVVWVVGDATIKGSETGTSFKQALYFKEVGFNIHDTMIYLKQGCGLPSYNRYLQCFEFMFIFSKQKPKAYNLIEDRKNRFKRWGKTKQVREKDGNFTTRETKPFKPYGRRFNVWKIATGGQGNQTTDEISFEHPATFPEQLANDHIISWSNEGDVVLDPMCGSGTTCKMAYLNRRNFIGIDISEKYCEIARKRINDSNL